MPFAVIFLVFFAFNLNAQNISVRGSRVNGDIYHLGGAIGIGTDAPASSSLLDINSTEKGILIPRLSSRQISAVQNPANSLLVFNTTENMFMFYDEAILQWRTLMASEGTSNAEKLWNRDNSKQGITFLLNIDDNVGIGTENPNASFEIKPKGNDALRILTSKTGISANIQFTDKDDSNYVGFIAPDTIDENILWQLPNVKGDSGQVLTTDGAGLLTWSEKTAADTWIRDSINNSVFLSFANDFVGIGTNIPLKPLHIFSSYTETGGGGIEPLAGNTADNYSVFRLENRRTSVSDVGFSVTDVNLWDFENANDTLNINYKGYIVQVGEITEKNFSFSNDGTFTAEKFAGDGSGLTNIELNGPIILDNEMEAWTNNGWSPRIQTKLGTVWASTNKSSLGDYYLGLGMTHSGWYFMTRYDNGDKDYVAVIREDGKILCKELEISKSSGGYWNTPFIKVKKPTNSDLAAFGFETNLQHWVIAAISSSSAGDGFWIKDIKNNKVPFKITNTGVVEIHDKLWVADEIAVQATNPWPDFVFKDNYKLMPLNQLQDYIKENGHLPNIPTSEDVKKEGIKLAQNQALMLQKIEELTLYIIDLKEENDKLKDRIVELENR
ncbi:MAG: hypothetical protein L3J35_00880 [Bacteroidales bacterium]|nr:hypothetical protein [Bacteroidales bacterium]